jgi:hypothetical protein
MHAAVAAASKARPNQYDPYKRIGLITKRNLMNKTISLGQMFDIYNDIRYISEKYAANRIDDSLLRPLLFAMMGIFAHNMRTALKKVYMALNEIDHSGKRFALLNLAMHLENIYIGHRQFGVNCGFGDFDASDSELEIFGPETKDGLFDFIISADEIKTMKLFEILKTDYDFFIYILRKFETECPFFYDLFNSELNANNFSKGSVYAYFDVIFETQNV